MDSEDFSDLVGSRTMPDEDVRFEKLGSGKVDKADLELIRQPTLPIEDSAARASRRALEVAKQQLGEAAAHAAEIYGKPRQGKEHVPTAELRARVKEAALAGGRLELIAKAIGISMRTLYKHYSYELDHSPLNKGNPHQPNDELRARVRIMAGVGTRREVIAHSIGVATDTLSKYYSEELKHAPEKTIAAVASSLYTKAIMGDTASMIFFLKTRAGWREKQAGDDADNPIHVKNDISVSAIAQQIRQARIAEQQTIEHEETDK